MIIRRAIQIVGDKLRGEKKDYFLNAKYGEIKRYYGRTVLDVGTGIGAFGDFVATQGHHVQAIDVVNDRRRNQSLPFVLFDGAVIPYPDKSFDTSIAMFVLHHVNNQEQLLKEMIRVTSHHIIIGEDIVCNWFDRALGRIHLDTAPWRKGVDSFRTGNGWTSVFEKLGCRIVDRQIIARAEYPIYPVPRIIYTLAVAPVKG